MALLDAGADLLDVGGESARGDRPKTAAEEEIDRVVPLIARLTGELGALVSVDTYKPRGRGGGDRRRRRARQRRLGAARRGDGRRCARATGAGLVLMHTRVAPKGTLLDPAPLRRRGGRRRRLPARADGAGASRTAWRPSSSCSTPGPTSRKTPAQTVAVLRALGDLHALGRPLLLAVSQQGLRRRADRPRAARAAGGHAGGARARRRRRRAGAPRARRRGRRRLPARARRAARRGRAGTGGRADARPLPPAGSLARLEAQGVAGRCAQRGRMPTDH